MGLSACAIAPENESIIWELSMEGANRNGLPYWRLSNGTSLPITKVAVCGEKILLYSNDDYVRVVRSCAVTNDPY